MTPPSSPTPTSRLAVFALSPRAAVLLAAAVVAVAIGVVALGSLPGNGGSSTAAPISVTGAPSARDGGASAAGATPGPGATPGSAVPGAAAAGVPVVSVVVVHVVGAVARPGVVRLPAGSRVADAVTRAGDAGADADLTRLNLARQLVDGERVYVPRVGETEVPPALDASDAGGVGAGAAGGDGGSLPGGASDVVDLNTADQATLETLPGIGPSLAGRILAWREEHGRFGAVEDLLDVSGIGDGRFADLRDRVRV